MKDTMDDHDSTHLLKHALAGVGAGMAGTAVMFAMRAFDTRYAPETLPKMKDAGKLVVGRVNRLLPDGTDVPRDAEKGVELSAGVAYGSLFGLLYSMGMLLLPKSEQSRHPFVLGGALGVLVWAASYLGVMPGLGLAKPAWKHDRAELAGELTRHVAYGVATAAAYGTIHDAL